MPPQIKQDLNRSGWETTDLPSVCEKCLGDNPFTQILKEDYGAECKICTRPFTVFLWKADRTSRQKKTGVCLTCARLKNCCQCCMMDLTYGLPITIRDAALKMVAPGPQSDVNREYFAQNNEREIEEGRGLEEYDKTDEKGRELLRRLAQSEPHYKRQRRLEAEAAAEGGQKLLEDGNSASASNQPGPIRTADSKSKSKYGNPYGSLPRGGSQGGRGGARGGRASLASRPPKPEDFLPPVDPNITSLFITGVEDDLPENDLRAHFSQYGPLRSVVCSHRSHCAFMNYMDRAGAEAAAASCQGRAVVKGVPLRVQWGKPKPLDSMDRDQRMANAKAGRETEKATKAAAGPGERRAITATSGGGTTEDFDDLSAVAPPPGQGDVEYAAMAGD